MRAIVRTAVGVIELNYSWLPTWIGMNSSIKRDLEKKLKPCIEGMPINEASLDHMHEIVVEELVALNPSVDGLREYLDGLKYVTYGRVDGKETS